MGCLYQIEFPNGKSYIGATLKSLNRRFIQHKCEAKRGMKLPIYSALREFGCENVKAKVLVISNDREYLHDLERKAVEIYDTQVPNGYNATIGGLGRIGNNGRTGFKWSEESKKKNSESQKGKVNIGNKYSVGRIVSQETRDKISIALKGRKLSPETCAKMSESRMGKQRKVRKIK